MEPGEAVPADEVDDDSALKEETTLGACLMRILNTSRDPHLGPVAGLSSGCSHTEDFAAMEDGFRCHGSNCPACNVSSSLADGSDYAQLPEEEKLQKWRAAGAALRRALAESSQEANGSTSPAWSRCKSGCQHHKGRKARSSNEDPMNEMLDEYQNETVDSTDTTSLSNQGKAYKDLPNDHKHKKHKSVVEQDGDSVSPGLQSVREKIREITSKIKDKDMPIPMASAKPTSAKERGRLSRNASKEVESSSDSGEEPEAVRVRPSHKCRRTLSSGSAKLFGKDDTVDRRRSRESLKLSTLPSQPGSELEASRSCTNLEQDVSHLKINDETLSDAESDLLNRKLQMLSQRQNSDEQRKVGKPGQKLSRLSTVETDSLPNLADIESSPVSDEPDTVTESEAEVFHPAGRTCRNSICRNGVLIGGKTEDFGVCQDAQLPPDLPACYSCGAGMENVDHRGSSERSQETPTRGIHGSHSADEDTGCDCNGDDYDLDDVVDLDLSPPSSSSGGNASKVSLTPEDLEQLPCLGSGNSSGTPSDRDEDADDEFECDCSVCQHRRGSKKSWVTEEDTTLQQPPQGDTIEYHPSPGLSDGISINLAEITPLDLLLMRDGRREIIDLMFQNVIMQMLSVYPDLLSDQAPPPAPPSTILSLPTVNIRHSQTEKDFVCPICLCNFEASEEARQLPCHHMFHTLCIQAWLTKSGTCPVCRHILRWEQP